MASKYILTILFCPLLCFAQPGIPDNSFGTGSGMNRVKVETDNVANGVQALPNDELIISARVNIGLSLDHHVVFKCSKEGLLDNTFGIKRLNVNPMWNLGHIAMSLSITPSGKVIASNSAMPGVYRFLPNGSEDASFGSNGYAHISQFSDWHLSRILVQPDERILLMGRKHNGTYFLARMNEDGSLDAGFNNNGGYATSSYGTFLSLKTDGKILMHWYQSNSEVHTMQFLSNGQVDNSFGNNGHAITTLPYMTSYKLNAFTLLPNGKILIGGSLLNLQDKNGVLFDIMLARLNSDGSIDNSFGINGASKIERLGYNDFINSIAIQPDGKILAAGYTESAATGISQCILLRFTENGALDNNFGSNGITITAVGNNMDGISDIALQSDGRIVAAGYTETKPPLTYGEKEITLIRYHGDVSAGTNTIENQSAFTLYPNPAQHHISLQLPDNATVSYHITNIYGQPVQQGKVAGRQPIVITTLPQGVYFIAISYADGAISTKQFVKQ